MTNPELPRRHDTLQIFFFHIPKLHVPSDCPTEFAPPTSPLTPPFRTLKTLTFCFLCFCCSDEIRPGDQTCPILGKTWSLGDQTRTILGKTCRHHLCHLHFGLLENRHCVPKGGFGVISYNSSLRSDVYHIWVNLSPSAITLPTSPYRT